MTTTTFETHKGRLDTQNRGNHFDQVIEAILPQFDSMMKSYVAFNAFFLSVGCLEFFLLVIFFTLLAQSAVLATSLALVFLTFFSYFILRLYLQTKKPEQFFDLRDRYIKACKKILHYQEGVPEHSVELANACSRFANQLHERDIQFYTPPTWLDPLNPYIQRFSSWCHWDDVHRMQELMLQAVIEENIKLVKSAPTSLGAHAALANAYILLSQHYKTKKLTGIDEEQLLSDEVVKSISEEKYRAAAQRAIEEFKIINEFSPNDPWVHTQLAILYHNLNLTSEELNEYEVLCKLNPEDKEALFKLGQLYFQQGCNGKGLRIYEQLKQFKDIQADQLISFYGSVNHQE